ncbi:MAG: hypothetical protein PWP52_669 [Bacteroidales bacterium]|nr:hypothetical protein [Bacteroidales bacterium]
MEKELMQILEDIWTNQISKTYNQGLLCSERQLQAEFYHHLKAEKYNDYTVWLEPVLEIRENPLLHHKKPDIMISKDNEIVGVIELKYNLEKGINVTNDFEKLKAFSTLNGDTKIPLYTDITNGNWDNDKNFSFSKDLILIFAVIAWEDVEALNTKALNEKKSFKHKNMYHLIGSVNKDTTNFKLNKF